MKPWSLTKFDGVNNVNDVSALKQPDLDQFGRSGSGSCELVKAVNFDIDDDGGLLQRDSSQEIFSASYDAKLTQVLGGRTFTAEGNILTYTKPWSTELEPRRSSIEYENLILLIQEVEEGLWVSTTEQIFFHRGKNPTAVGGFTQVAEFPYSAIPGTGEKVHASKLGLDSSGYVAVFATTWGICYGTATGSLVNMSEGVFTYAPGQYGISTIKEKNGIVQYIVKMINPAGEMFNPNERKVEIIVDTI